MGREPSSALDFPLARQWIDDCANHHKTCTPRLDVPLPTRILDLSSPEGNMDLRLRDSSEETGRYAALSHCWGKTKPIQLTTETLEHFQKGISFSELPKTFQDAVVATRNLGLSFLWIDSLCIIQNSTKDWEEQCGKMAQFYMNAEVTLAGPAASGCNSGFLHSRPEPRRKITLDFHGSGSGGNGLDHVSLLHYGITEAWSSVMPELDSPLAKRGWVLQESLLSCRVLYFGSSRMYLECFQNARFESCHVPIIWASLSTKTINASKARIDRFQNNPDGFKYWRSILEAYSKKLLTNPTDRLPALSGLASEIHKVTNAEYLAGIWREDIFKGLAWHIPSYAWENPSPVSPSQEYIAPSWSWAAAKHEFIFSPTYRCVSILEAMEIVQAQVSLAGLDKFGAVQDGFIEVQGKVKRSTIRRLPHPYRSDDFRLCVSSEDAQFNALADYYPDNADVLDEDILEVLLLYMGIYWIQFSATEVPNPIYVALGIEVTGRCQNEYRRVGLAYVEINEGNVLPVLDQGDKFPRMFEPLSMSKLRIV